jgi:ribosomal protein S18 acetylase RimI-like enzyme
MLQIRQAARAEFAAIASLMARFNEHPATQCIHSGEGAESICKQMEIWDDAGEFRLVGAWQAGQLVGAFGCEFDEALGRGWLWGPFAGDEETADLLFTHLLKSLPPTINQLHSYLHIENEAGDAFYRRHGFAHPKVAHVYIALPPAELVMPPELLPECKQAQVASFARLHDAIFPHTFDSGKDILAKLDETHKLFVYADGNEVLGFVYAKADESSEEGYVEFLGVSERVRRQGVGRKLLATAVFWLFHDQQVPQIGLNVHDDNANARSLYESAGFRLAFTGVGLRCSVNSER